MKLLLPLLAVYTTITLAFPLEKALNLQPKAASANYRLPTHINPLHYDLTLEPDFSDFTFTGEATIEVEITEETDNITLHAYNLTVGVDGVTFGNVGVANVSYDDFYQFLVITFEESVPEGSYVLKISYDGYLNSNNRGFYRGNYQDQNGETR